MMDTLGESKVAEAIDKAVHQALDSKQIKSLAAGRMGMGTTQGRPHREAGVLTSVGTLRGFPCP
jgi:hypothetical protein